MSIGALMFVDRSIMKGDRPMPVNCVATVLNFSSAPVTITYFQVNRGTNAAASRNVPNAIGTTVPAANSLTNAPGQAQLSWAESVLAGSPPVSGQPSLQTLIGFSVQTSDGSTAASSNASISVYAEQPPSVSLTGANQSFLSGTSAMPVFADNKGDIAPYQPQVGQVWFEDSNESALIGALSP